MTVYNRELALDRVGGDEELLDEIVELYLGEYPGLLEQLHTAVSNGDANQVFRSAHTLKGSLSTIGAEAAQESALALEMSGRNGQLDQSRAMLADLERLLGQLHRELSQSKPDR